MPPTVGSHLISPDDDRPYNLRPRPLVQSNIYALETDTITKHEANAVIHQDKGQAQEYIHPKKGPDKIRRDK